MSAIDERDAYAATVADARSFLRGEYKRPMSGTLAHEISERQRDRFLDGLVVACCAVAAILLIVAAGIQSAGAQSHDWRKPALSPLPAVVQGAYVDPTFPARYCIAEGGVWSGTQFQTFIYCSLGGPAGGLAFVTPSPVVGQEYLLYRTQADGGLLSWTVATSVTITRVDFGEIRVRFGSPGAQTPEYRLALL